MLITPLEPPFAARVTGLDIAAGAAIPLVAELRAAFARHPVLVFADQRIDDAQQIAFSRLVGPLELTRTGAPGAGSELIVLSNIGPDGQIAPPTDKQVLSNRANRFWHHDSSFKPVPARASMLSAREIPTDGGDTEFACTRAAWAELPEPLRQDALGRIAVHDFGWSRTQVAPELMSDAERAALPAVRHPIVAQEALYLGAHVRRLEDMDESAGRALIEELMAFATQPRFVHRHAWRPHDLVLWDNRAVLHRATPFATATERRYMVRTTIAGDADYSTRAERSAAA